MRKIQDSGGSACMRNGGSMQYAVCRKGLEGIIFLTCIFLLLSCSKEKETVQTAIPREAGLYKIELSPVGAKKDSTIAVKVTGVGPSDLSYQWVVNNILIGGYKESFFKYPKLRKGDSVQAKVLIKSRGEFISEPLTIANTIPQIQSARLLPQYPKKGDNIKAEVKTFDGDDDNVSLTYAWFVNGEKIPGETSDEFRGETVKRGDKVAVKITPSDGEQNGEAVTLYVFIINSLPMVSPNIETGIEGLTYKSKINAADPDEDTLKYTIKQSPKGMTIDANGVITWKVSAEDKGEHNIVVSVSDGQGGEVIVPFTTTIILQERR